MNDYIESQAIDLWREVFRSESPSSPVDDAVAVANAAVDAFRAKFLGAAPKE